MRLSRGFPRSVIDRDGSLTIGSILPVRGSRMGTSFSPEGGARSRSSEGADATRARAPRAKRLLDIAIAVPLLVVLAPLMALLALGIKVSSRGPVLYRCRRVGFLGREFDMLKFRKMRDGATGPPLTGARDERFTRFGSFLARSKLDELPQLWNVIRGEMSLVGPRPEDPAFVPFYPEEFDVILTVRPGVSGLSQLAFAQESRLLDVPDPVEKYAKHLLPEKLRIDRLYIEQRSLRMDLRILAATVLAILGVNVTGLVR
jgi:lipopolysaccharide/colanic/teichoic acid biosynthesis glycosyltransferase